ncbi:MAG TPA: ABC transporter substrate-binding protein [Mycobacteriales bacterium]|nr:ABC transporter substrate-binding protein [Mycobacteriales bacterium]
MTPSISRRTPAIAMVISVASALLVACGGGGGASRGNDVALLVSAPITTSPWIAEAERNGAELAAAQLNAAGGVTFGGKAHHVRIEVHDNGGSPQRVVADAQTAVSEHAAALIIDGVGANAVADVTDPAHLPVFVVFDGGESFIDPTARPTLFRLAPADQPMAMRLADYLAGKHPKIGLITDDTGFGTDGAASLKPAFVRDKISVVDQTTVPSTTGDVSTQILAARRAGASTLVVWASASIVAASVQAARSTGWNVPVWAGPSGEDPLVRQRLATHPAWLDGVGFVSFRITAEVGAKPFDAYRKAYEQKYGADRINLKQNGKDVVQPPDWSMFSYDTVKLVAAALEKSGGVGAPLLSTLEGKIVITGANGDERGYLASTREGVSPDDMYFAQFHGFTFAPVTDDLLSQNLPAVPQTE